MPATRTRSSARGDHTYVLRYRTSRQIRWFDGKPELNWNVTGNFWHFPILAASYRLELPAEARPVRWTAFTGRLGARGIDWEGEVSRLGVLTVDTTRRLAPGEGLTVVAEIPASAIDAPSQAQLCGGSCSTTGAGFSARSALPWCSAITSPPGTRSGAIPKRGVVIPLFHPPEGVSPALANYIHHWGFAREKWRAFTAACLSLAVRGLIRMDNSKGALSLIGNRQEPARHR